MLWLKIKKDLWGCLSNRRKKKKVGGGVDLFLVAVVEGES